MRIAAERHVDQQKLKALVDEHIEHPILGLGTERVHVLRLNIALDKLDSKN